MLAVALSACAAPQALTPGEHLTVVNQTDLPAPTGRDIAAVGRDYHIAPFDQLKINVYGVEELNQVIHADAQGSIALPLVGRIDAGGLTLTALTELMTQRLARYVRNPQVSVNLEQTTSQVVTVYGQVNDPGLFPIVGEMTLLRAVARARGLTDIANTQDVVVFRTVDNQRMAALYNLDAIRRGAYPDPKIYANDVVVVGDSPGRALFKSILAVSPLLVTPIIVLLQKI
jgi:polysaccharide biosynthesis/export protein